MKKLFLVQNNAPAESWSVYLACVVVAENEFDAQRIYPNSSVVWSKKGWVIIDEEELYLDHSLNDTWVPADKVHALNVTYLGVAAAGLSIGDIIITDYIEP